MPTLEQLRKQMQDMLADRCREEGLGYGAAEHGQRVVIVDSCWMKVDDAAVRSKDPEPSSVSRLEADLKETNPMQFWVRRAATLAMGGPCLLH